MIKIKNHNNLIEIEPTGSLKTGDFDDLAKKADKLIDTYGNIKLLINAQNFEGWDSLSASEAHFTFVQKHHKDVEKAAIIVGHSWQEWVASILKVFLHPEIRIFQSSELKKAQSWIQEK